MKALNHYVLLLVVFMRLFKMSDVEEIKLQVKQLNLQQPTSHHMTLHRLSEGSSINDLLTITSKEYSPATYVWVKERPRGP